MLDIQASLGESAIWSIDEQVLFWVDINKPSLNRFDPASGVNTQWLMPEAIGCCAMRRGGGFVVALRGGVWLVDEDGRLVRKLADAPYDPKTHRFNDGRADAAGRFWAGSMNESHSGPSAQLYRIEASGAISAVLSDMTISNGLAWSPDGRTMYHADTVTRTIHAYAFDPATGAPAQRRVLARFEGETERPDGAAVDSEGAYWSALYRGGKVVRVGADGRLLAEHPIPAMCPTMCAFGGPDLRTLYVTTARQRREPAELARYPQSGGIFAMPVDVAGLPESKYAG